MNNMPSTAAQVIVTIIPIVGIVMGATVLFLYILLSYRAKKFMIEKGLYKRPAFDIDTFSLFLGLIMTGTGASLVLFFLVKQGFDYGLLGGLVPLSVGISLLVFFGIRSCRQKMNG